MEYDAIFVGAGISSLYANYLYLKKHPHAKTIILEKSNKVGGRIGWDMLNGVEIATGAGIGRYDKDKLLLALIKELNIEYNIFGGPPIPAVAATVRKLEKAALSLSASPADTSNETFREFGIRVLGMEKYTEFVKQTGYSDFEAYETKTGLKYYGFDDIYKTHKYFHFSWRELITKISNGMLIKKNTSVIEIKNETITAETQNKKVIIYHAPHIFVGVTINCLRKLFPNIYPAIHSQPFIRIYAELNKQLPIQYYTIVNSILQKVIPISGNIYMIAYADNASAAYLKTISNSSKKLSLLLQNEFKDPEIQVLKKKTYYWDEGTHYYSSSIMASDPNIKLPKNITIIGELIADNQGWVNPILEHIKTLSKDEQF